MKLRLFVIASTVLLCQTCVAQQHPTPVSSNGTTTVTMSANGKMLKALIQTMVVPKTPPNSPERHFAQCTSSRTPCVLTSEIKLLDGANEVFVPRGAYADLGDIFSAELAMGNGIFVLTIRGSDASEAYIAKLEFNKDRVIRRTLYSAEDTGHPVEVSQFFMVSSDN
jgi:hypothetical protein